MTDRDAQASPLAGAFDFTQPPRLQAPKLRARTAPRREAAGRACAAPRRPARCSCAKDPRGDVVTCDRGASRPPARISSSRRASATELGTVAMWRLTFDRPVEVPSDLRIDILVRDPRLSGIQVDDGSGCQPHRPLGGNVEGPNDRDRLAPPRRLHDVQPADDPRANDRDHRARAAAARRIGQRNRERAADALERGRSVWRGVRSTRRGAPARRLVMPPTPSPSPLPTPAPASLGRGPRGRPRGSPHIGLVRARSPRGARRALTIWSLARSRDEVGFRLKKGAVRNETCRCNGCAVDRVSGCPGCACRRDPSHRRGLARRPGA